MPRARKQPVSEITLVQVLVRRDETFSVPVIVPEHEVAVLKVAFDDNVQVLKADAGKQSLEGFNVADEYARLVRKYNTRNSANPALMVYGNDPSRLADALGLDGDAVTEATPIEGSQQIEHPVE